MILISSKKLLRKCLVIFIYIYDPSKTVVKQSNYIKAYIVIKVSCVVREGEEGVISWGSGTKNEKNQISSTLSPTPKLWRIEIHIILKYVHPKSE